jgi:choline dehydrogenase-like flavoprotein
MGGNATGALWFTMSLDPKDETRSTSEIFYDPRRRNLHLLTDNQVTRLLFDPAKSKPSIIGVEYMGSENASTSRVLATKEVILAAGALHTPQLLELSGIGDGRVLPSYGIQTIVDLPGVGANYQDHPLIVTVHTGEELWSKTSVMANAFP